MSKSSKVTIAAAVLVGLALSDRLQELGIEDEIVRKSVGDLATALGNVMNMVEKVDIASSIVQRAAQNDDLLTVVEGMAAIKGVTADLVSDQDKIMEAMMGGLSEEEALMFKLLAELGGLVR